jgi:hypothetical protein
MTWLAQTEESHGMLIGASHVISKGVTTVAIEIFYVGFDVDIHYICKTPISPRRNWNRRRPIHTPCK